MKSFLILLLTILPSLVMAESAVEDHHDIPKQLIIYQTLNVVLLFVLLTVLLHKKVVSFFTGRKDTYEEAFIKAQMAREEAERKQKEISKKIDELESNYKASLEKAERKAEEQRQPLIKEAHELAQRMKTEAEKAGRSEVTMAIETLKAEMLNEAVSKAEEIIKNKMETKDHQVLQENIVKNMGAASR